MIGIHTPESAGEKNAKSLKKHLDAHGLTFPIAIDNTTKMWHRYSNHYWPSVYIIDQEGIVRWGWQGEVGWKGAKGEMHMRKKIDLLLE